MDHDHSEWTVEPSGERALLVGIAYPGQDGLASRSLDELAQLTEHAGADVVGRIVQTRDSADHATWIGKGKLMEALDLAASCDATTLVFDDELAPRQLRTLRQMTPLKVIDRTGVILDLFAQHALSEDGRVRVELAQLRYQQTRLIGAGEALSRQGGGIGTRGPGETKLETDRRQIQARMATLRRRLATIQAHRARVRARRQKTDVATMAVVGYTNAGKTTVVNALCHSTLVAADSLFMTLDPSARRLDADGEALVIIDTVGFIRHLPTHLAEAFAATLEEIVDADMVLIVVDVSDPEAIAQFNVVYDQLKAIGCLQKPRLLALNKIDGVDPTTVHDVARTVRTMVDEVLFISAKTGDGLDSLQAAVRRWSRHNHIPVSLRVPYSAAHLVAHLKAHGRLDAVRYEDDAIALDGAIDRAHMGPFSPYLEPSER